MPNSPEELRDKLRRVRLLVCDVDGVLTDGRLVYEDGGESSKTFHVRDGMGLRLLKENGIEVAILTAKSGAAVAKRMSDLKIEHVVLGRGDKARALEELLAKLDVSAKQCAYVGDDVLDLPALRMAGLSVTVADGHQALLAEVDLVTQLGGGQGAVRELCDEILDAQIGLEVAVRRVLDGAHQKGPTSD